MQQIDNLFEPADFSLEELAFAKENLGKSPNVALDGGVPDGVNPIAVKALLGRIFDLEELRTLKHKPWGFTSDPSLTGLEAIEDSIDRFIAWQAQCRTLKAQGGVRHPSQHTWDSMGNITHGGIGSDASEKVRHEITADGTRKPFAVVLREDGRSRHVKMPWQKPAPKMGDDRITLEDGVYKCSICEKPIASFDPSRGKREQNKARKTVRDHIRNSKTELARHRALVNVPFP